MSLKNYSVIEQNERGWKKSRGIAKHKKLKKKLFSKLRRKTKFKVGFKGFEY